MPAASLAIPVDHSEELRRFFDAVHNRENWKHAIDAFVTPADLAQTVRAIEWYTGGKTTVSYDASIDAFHITSPGYYNVCGA